MSTNVEEPNQDSLVWGAAAIGQALNLDPRRFFYQLEAGRNPYRRMGPWRAVSVTLPPALSPTAGHFDRHQWPGRPAERANHPERALQQDPVLARPGQDPRRASGAADRKSERNGPAQHGCRHSQDRLDRVIQADLSAGLRPPAQWP